MKRTYLLLCLSLMHIAQGVNPRFKFGIEHPLCQPEDIAKNLEITTALKCSTTNEISSSIKLDFIDPVSIIRCLPAIYILDRGGIILHELGHVGMAILLGYKLKNIQISPYLFGSGSTVRVGSSSNPYHEICISAAGPLAGLLFGSTLIYVSRKIDSPLSRFFCAMGLFNLSWNMLNLYPKGNLDGAKILQSIHAIRNAKIEPINFA